MLVYAKWFVLLVLLESFKLQRRAVRAMKTAMDRAMEARAKAQAEGFVEVRCAV